MKQITAELWHSWFAVYLNGELHEVKHANALCCECHADFQDSPGVSQCDLNIWVDEVAENFLRGTHEETECRVVLRSHQSFNFILPHIGTPSGSVFK